MFNNMIFYRYLVLVMVLTGKVYSMNVPSLAFEKKYEPGMGFYPYTVHFRNPCVNGEVKWVKNSVAEVQLDKTLHKDKILSDIRAKFSGGANLIFASGKITNKLAGIVREEKHMEKLVYKSSVATGTTMLESPRLTDKAIQLANQGDYDAIIQYCGTEFIDKILHGADLYITVEFDFYDKYVKNEIETKIEFKVLGLKETKIYKRLSEDLKRRASVKIDAFQIGGNPDTLDRILKNARKKSCTLAKIEECHKIIDSLIQYAVGNDGILSQIKDGISPYTYMTKQYYEAGLEELIDKPNPIFNKGNLISLERLTSILAKNTSWYSEIKTILDSRRFLKPSVEEKFEITLNKVQSNINKIRKAIDECYKSPEACKVAEDGLSVEKIDPEKDLAFEKTFFYYCMKEKSAGIKKILELANETDCLYGEKYLTGLNDLDLSGLSINNIDFLKPLENLSNINLSENLILDVYVLSEAKKLESLNLRKNKIKDLSPVKSLVSLNKLYAQHNDVRKTDFVKKLVDLQYINLHSNLNINLDGLKTTSIPKKIVSFEDACNDQIDQFLESEKIGKKEADEYRKIHFAPLLDENNAVYWVNCISAIYYL